MFKLPGLKVSYDTYVRDISIVFLLLLPLTICNVVSIFLGYSLRAANHDQFASNLFYLSNILIGIYPIALCVITTYYLSVKSSTGSLLVLPYALMMFMAVSLPNELVSENNGLPNQPLIALLSAGISVGWCSLAKMRYLDPSQIEFSRLVYKQVVHFSGFVLITAALSKLIEIILQQSDKLSSSLTFDPMTISGGLIYQFILGLLGAVGINGHNFLFTFKQELFTVTQQNIAAWELGEVPLNILSQGFYDAFLSIGGSGNSLSLLLCILCFSRDKKHISLAIAALPLVMFNINELLLFGLPIIFNPTLIVPFILVPMASFIIVYGAIATGLVNPVGAIVDWMTPPLISGYLATQNSIGGVVLQLIVIFIGMMIYRPFYLHYLGNQKQPVHSSFTQSEIEHATFKTFVGDVGQNMTKTVDKYDVSRRLNKMLSTGKFVMFYQPQVHLTKHEHAAFESLIRYIDDEGNIQPPIFIHDFLQLNAIQHLDNLVIDLVLADMKTLQETGPCKVGINISPETISSPDIVKYIQEKLAFYDIPPHALEIEITEDAILEDHTIIANNINQLQQLGVQVAIDDFGAGYASFPHLLKFNFDKVKLDRSLLINTKEDRGQNLYQLLAKISEVTGCVLVSEGVETEEEKTFVQRCGIEICQGFYFARPMPLAAASRWLKKQSAHRKNPFK